MLCRLRGREKRLPANSLALEDQDLRHWARSAKKRMIVLRASESLIYPHFSTAALIIDTSFSVSVNDFLTIRVRLAEEVISEPVRLFQNPLCGVFHKPYDVGRREQLLSAAPGYQLSFRHRHVSAVLIGTQQ